VLIIDFLVFPLGKAFELSRYIYDVAVLFVSPKRRQRPSFFLPGASF
jgi:hypothetical protein